MDREKLVNIVAAANIAGWLEANEVIQLPDDEALLDFILEEYDGYAREVSEALEDTGKGIPAWYVWIRDTLVTAFIEGE